MLERFLISKGKWGLSGGRTFSGSKIYTASSPLVSSEMVPLFFSREIIGLENALMR
jgi:hypothetical protein